jgi:hypothetical protein
MSAATILCPESIAHGEQVNYRLRCSPFHLSNLTRSSDVSLFVVLMKASHHHTGITPRRLR